MRIAESQTSRRISTVASLPAQPKGWACSLSGLLVGVVAGAVGATLIAGAILSAALIGVGLGAFFGLLFGRKIAALETVAGGAALGAFLPIGLCLLDGMRSGRLLRASASEFTDSRFFVALGLMLGIGGTIGGLLVAVRKGLEGRADGESKSSR